VSAYLSTASLLLYPQSPEWFDQDLDLTDAVRTLGLAGDAIDATSYYAGERFLEHIAFMGCAPNIRFAPEQAGANFSHVRIHRYPAITALIGAHAPAPNCPHCKTAFAYEETQLGNLGRDSLWRCTQCQQSAPPWQYHWRKNAGFGRVFVEITDIYPKEAIPQQILMEALLSCSGTEWQYCYLF